MFRENRDDADKVFYDNLRGSMAKMKKPGGGPHQNATAPQKYKPKAPETCYKDIMDKREGLLEDDEDENDNPASMFGGAIFLYCVRVWMPVPFVCYFEHVRARIWRRRFH